MEAAPAAIGPMRARVTSWLAAQGASAEVREDAALVASELLSNAVGAARGPEGDIRIQVMERPEGWRVTVADRGVGLDRPRPHGGPPVRTGGQPSTAALDVEGRGLAMVRHVAGEVSIERKHGGWTVVSAVVPARRRTGEVTSQGSGPSSR
jgi:anti-sigma regulatory factor (Ser/Thr protein kinase)